MRSNLKVKNILVSAFIAVTAFVSTVASADSVFWNAELAISSNPDFVQTDQSDFLYVKAEYLSSGSISNAVTIEDFFGMIESQNKSALPEPSLVPIGVGDLLIFIPYQSVDKRVGDAFVQLRYVRDQIHSILGRHFINSAVIDNETVQVNDLYNNALTYSFMESVEFGRPLTEEQKNSISVDMVWPEYRNILGQQVLVPVVYLSPATVENRAVNGHLVEFEGDASFEKIEIILGEISVKRDAFLIVREDLVVNEGAVVSGDGELNLIVGGTLRNYSGEITAIDNVNIIANSLVHKTVVHVYDDYFGWGKRAGEIADINSQTGDVTIDTFQNISVYGGEINSPGSITLSAGGRIRLSNIRLVSHTRFGDDDEWTSHSESSIDLLQTRLTAEENIQLLAQFIEINAAELVSSQGHIELLADYGIYITNSYSEYSQERRDATGDNQKYINEYKTSAVRAFLDAGIGITLTTGQGDVILRAVNFTSEDGVDISAKNGTARFLMAREQDHYFKNSVEENKVRIKVTESGHERVTPVYSSIVGGVSVDALYGVEIEYETKSSLRRKLEAQSSNVDLYDVKADLEELGALAWMTEIPLDSVAWAEADLVYRDWRDVDRDLTEEATTVLAIIVAIVTNGAGAGWVGAAEGTATAYIANAAVTTLITQAVTIQTNALLDGHVLNASQLFDEMSQSEYTKQLLISMITAGVMSNFPAGNSHFFSIGAGGEISLIDQAQQRVMRSVLRTGIGIVVNGGDLGDIDGETIRYAIQESAIAMLGQHMATTIGNAFDVTDPTSMDTAFKYIAHAGSGCIYGALSADLNESVDISEGCGAGAGGALLGEFVNEQYRKELDDDLATWVESRLGEPGDYTYAEFDQDIRGFLNRGLDLVRFTTAIAAFAAGINGDIALGAADIAARYNSNRNINQITSRSSFNFVSRMNQIRANPATILFSDALSTSFNQIIRILGGETLDVLSDDFFRTELDKYPTLSTAISAAASAGFQNAEENVEAYVAVVLLGVVSTYGEWIDGAENIGTGVTPEPLTALEAQYLAYDLKSAVEELKGYEVDRLYFSDKNNQSMVNELEGLISEQLGVVAKTLARYPSLRVMVDLVDSSPPGFPINDEPLSTDTILPIPDIESITTLIRAMLDEPIDSTLPGSPIPEQSVPWRTEFPIVEQNPLDSILFNLSGFEATDGVSVSGDRPIDRGRSYEGAVNDKLYGGTVDDRNFVVVNEEGELEDRIADNVIEEGGSRIAIESKYVDSWGNSISNPGSVSGDRPWSINAQQELVDQAKAYSNGFDEVRYHTNSEEFAKLYSGVFEDEGITNVEFIITPAEKY